MDFLGLIRQGSVYGGEDDVCFTFLGRVGGLNAIASIRSAYFGGRILTVRVEREGGLELIVGDCSDSGDVEANAFPYRAGDVLATNCFWGGIDAAVFAILGRGFLTIFEFRRRRIEVVFARGASSFEELFTSGSAPQFLRRRARRDASSNEANTGGGRDVVLKGL